MLAIVQRVSRASVTDERAGHEAGIDGGLCVLLGVVQDDLERDADWIVRKLVHLRIFPDDAGKMNRSVIEACGSILLVSQFTLAGDCSRGNRPSFVRAADPAVAEPLYERVVAGLRDAGIPVETGVFGGMMRVEITNEGPVTIILDSSVQ